MLRTVFAIFGACVAAVLVFFLIESAGGLIWPPPPELMDAMSKPDAMEKLKADPAKIKELMSKIPIGGLLTVIVAYAAGSFAGGWLAVRLAKSASVVPGLIVGAVLMAFGFMNLMMLPHPAWFAIMSTLMYLPMSFAGAKMAVRKT